MYQAEYLPRAILEALGFAALGEDVRIHPSCVLVGCNRIHIGSHVRIDPFCVITPSSTLSIGNFVHISAHATLLGAGTISIGDFACVSHGARILSSSDDLTGSSLMGPMVPMEWRNHLESAITLAAHTVLGVNSVVLPGGELGEGATVGALSLVKTRLGPWTVNAGIPSAVVGHRDPTSVLHAARQLQTRGQQESR